VEPRTAIAVLTGVITTASGVGLSGISIARSGVDVKTGESLWQTARHIVRAIP
jgi:hypothetical protein